MSSASTSSTMIICKYHGQVRSDITQDTTHVDVSESVQELPPGALRDLYLLVQVNLPKGLRVIGQSAFQFCSFLKFISFPDSLQEIQAHAFEYCTNLTFDCGDGSSSKLLDLPEGITVIGDQAFAMSCQSIEYLQLPSTLVTLGRGSFSHWSNLVSVGLHEEGQLETIGDYAFYGAHALCNIAIPSTVTYVGRWAFGRCHQLQTTVLCYKFDSSDETVEKAVRTRFEDLPLHKMMYFDGNSTSEMEMSELVTAAPETLNALRCDVLGMTPLDILMLAPKPQYDLVPIFVQHFPETVFIPKNGGKTPALYACSRKAPAHVVETLIKAQMKSVGKWLGGMLVEPPHWASLIARANQSDAMDILQSLLRMQLNDRIESLRLDRWKQDIHNSIHELSSFAEDRTERLVQMEAIYHKVDIYERMEVISNLELCVWKVCIRETIMHANREDCRIYSGSESILSNVIPFLYEVTTPTSRNHSPITCRY